MPEDGPVHLFVLSMASLSVMYSIYTSKVYELEIANQERNSLSRISRDLEAAFIRRLAALKRKEGDIQDIPYERVLKRPPNFLIVAMMALFTVSLIAYAQFDQLFAAQAVAFFTTAGPYLAVSALIVFALAIYVWARRRRK